MIKLISFFITLLAFTPYTLYSTERSDYDDTYVKKVKSQLQRELKSEYLQKVIDTIGSCNENPLKCITQISDVVTFQAKDKSICFPYTECGFYKCMEDKYQCSKVGVNYFTDLAYPTCNTYKKNIKKSHFSKKGQEWIYNVMVCLQKGLVNECELDDNCSDDVADRKTTCEHITKFTLDFHPGCYINSGVGVCNLPFKDKMNIWKTVRPYLTKDEREQAYKVVFQCVTK